MQGDPGKFEQIATNLVQNALVAMIESGVGTRVLCRIAQQGDPADAPRPGVAPEDPASILRRASAEAERRGVDVETILREQSGCAPELRAATPTTTPAPAPAPSADIDAPFGGKERADVEAILRAHARAVAERAAVLDGASVEGIAGAFADPGPLNTRWANACQFGASSEALAEAVRANPFMTPETQGEADFVESLLLEEVLTFRAVKASERAPAGVVRLAHLHAEKEFDEVARC